MCGLLTLISVIRAGKVVIPRGDTSLAAGDKILALTLAAGVQELKDRFLSPLEKTG
ncbi:MAG: TrkA C-terminal domain-containing protein [Candidatus Tectomicrobia bacterium]|uniref:TrkA C-terminal domain-containing protein n=1 Tax=Tectimicrobiota bacterium TaxID=2528274 RepID=A0A932GR50_UNCTE|nr:TrkA C-terminal domain-containing protein [Candidatus Tectomicrobia bacterium]